MSDYLRIRTWLQLSENSDYHNSNDVNGEFESTPDEWRGPSKIDCVITTGTTIELGNYTTVTAIYVENTDATNFVELTHTYDGTAVVTYLPALGHTIVYNPTPANDLVITADTATCVCKVAIAGT